MKDEYARKLNLLKEKVEAKLKLKYMDAENEMTQQQSGLLKKQVEIYKKIKEQELKKAKGAIDQDHTQMLEEEKKQINLKEITSIEHIKKYIMSIKTNNQVIKDQVEDKIKQIQKLNPDYDFNQIKPKSLGKQFETIGDIEQTYQEQPSRTPRIINQQRFSKSPITDQRDFISMGYLSKNLSDPSRSSSTPKVMTPGVSSSVSHQLLYFNTPSNQSNEVVDKYKMREIRAYVANELYRQDKKTSALYEEFSRLKRLKEEIRILNQQTEIVVGDNQKPIKRMKQIDHNIETQYNVVRDQMKNINTKRDVLKRMRDNIKKLANNMVQKQRIDIETDLLNDYNYLAAKTKKNSEQARSSIKSHSSPFSNRISSDIVSQVTGQTDYEKFVDKWDKILKSGTGQNMYEWQYFNEFAQFMIPQDDIRLNTIKRFEKAVFELTQMDKKTLILRDGGDKFSFRQRIFNRQQEQANKYTRDIQTMIEGQYQWIKNMKMQLSVPSPIDLRQII